MSIINWLAALFAVWYGAKFIISVARFINAAREPDEIAMLFVDPINAQALLIALAATIVAVFA